MAEASKLKLIAMRQYPFLKAMYADSYFPKKVVDRCKAVLVDLCFEIEERPPTTLDELYALTHAATHRLNDLEEAFAEAGRELETGAREALGADFEAIARAYGFDDADVEELIATREW